MTWMHRNGYGPACDHEGGPQPVLDQTLDLPDGTPGIVAIDHGNAVVGWRARCSCQWKSINIHLRKNHPCSDQEAANGPQALTGEGGPLYLEWEEHFASEVPESHLRDLCDQGASDEVLTAEVQILRVKGATWKEIADAAEMGEARAWKRWKHVDLHHRMATGTDTRPGPVAFLSNLKELSTLAAPNSLHENPDPRVRAVEFATQGLERLLTRETLDGMDDAIDRLQFALDYAYQARADLAGGVGPIALRDLDSTCAAYEDPHIRRLNLDMIHELVDGEYQATVHWGGTEQDPRLVVTESQVAKAITDPVAHQKVSQALQLLGDARAPILDTSDQEEF